MKEVLGKAPITVSIQGKDYNVRELSLAQKIKVVGVIGEFIRDIAKNAFFKKNVDGKISFVWNDEISLAELNIDKVIISSLQAAPLLLELAIPDFTDWDNLPESETREPLLKALDINDFKGFVLNFIALGAAIIR